VLKLVRPLQEACATASIPIITLLLDAHAQPNAANEVRKRMPHHSEGLVTQAGGNLPPYSCVCVRA